MCDEHSLGPGAGEAPDGGSVFWLETGRGESLREKEVDVKQEHLAGAGRRHHLTL